MSSVTSSTGTIATTNVWSGAWGGTSSSGIDLSDALSDVNNGVDYNSIVNQLTAINQQSVTKLQNQLTALQTKQTAFQDIQSKVSALQTAVAALKDINNLRQATADSSNMSVVVASAGKTSEEGSHDIVVNQLAKSERMLQTAGQEALTSTVGAGTFEYTYKGVTRTIQTTDTTTLQGLVDQINNDSGNSGVAASTLQYNGSFHLVLAARDTGSSNTIAINDAGTTLAGFATAGFTVTQAAQDAQIRVDGFPPANTDPDPNASANWLTRGGNSITDVIPGVTLNILSAGASSVTFNRDPSAIAGDLQAMVTAYNDLQTTITKYTRYDSTSKTAGVLQGNSQVTGLTSQIRGMLGGAIAGFKAKDIANTADPGNTFSTGQQIGLYFGMKLDGSHLAAALTNDKSGTLSLDTDQLTAALKSDFEGVLSLIANGLGSGGSDNTRLAFDSALANTQAGSYQVQVTYNDTGSIVSAQIRKVGESAWRAALVSGSNIGGAAGSPEEGLSLTASFDTTRGGGYTDTAVVRFSEGFAGQLDNTLNGLLNSSSGHLFTDGNASYDAQVKAMNQKITARQAFVDKENQHLKDKYARLQATLAQLQGQKAAVENSLKQFNTKSTD